MGVDFSKIEADERRRWGERLNELVEQMKRDDEIVEKWKRLARKLWNADRIRRKMHPDNVFFKKFVEREYRVT